MTDREKIKILKSAIFDAVTLLRKYEQISINEGFDGFASSFDEISTILSKAYYNTRDDEKWKNKKESKTLRKI